MKRSTYFLALILFVSLNAKSQEYNETIDIDGNYEPSTNQTTRLEKMRRRLEKQNELMVRKRIEHIRYQNEMKLIKDTQKAMNKILRQ